MGRTIGQLPARIWESALDKSSRSLRLGLHLGLGRVFLDAVSRVSCIGPVRVESHFRSFETLELRGFYLV